MIRVLEVIPTMDRGGAEKQLALLATRLPREQFETHVCLLTRGGPLREMLDEADVPVTEIHKCWKVDVGAYNRLKRLIQQLRPDIVHTWLFAANSYGRYAALQAGVPHVIGGERCVDPWKSWHQLAIDRYLAHRSERIATNTSAVRDFYAARGIPAEKFVVIPNGVAALSGHDPLPREELLRELDIPSDARLIGAVGRLWPQKRIKDLIWAAHLLDEAQMPIRLLIIGDGPHRWRLERYASQVDFGRVVRFLGVRDDVPRLMPCLDCLWLGSAYEGQSNAVMEAMAAGIPVVATNIPGNRDLIVPDETGFLVPVGDRGAFAKWTMILLNDGEMARRMGEAGRNRVRDEFSIDRMVQRHASLYRELVG